MSRFRKEVKDDFTVVHNDFIKDKRLTWAERGLLLTLMQLPDDWNYSIAGLAALTPDGTYKVSALLKKLKAAGYFRRIRLTDPKGRVIDWIYEFSDQVHEEWINSDDTFMEDQDDTPPQSGNSHVDESDVGDCTQSNTNISNTKYIDYDQTEKEIKENIDYEKLCEVYSESIVQPVVNVITETAASTKATVRINKKTKLTRKDIQKIINSIRYSHICAVLDAANNCNTQPKYYKPYILTALVNAVKQKDDTISKKPKSDDSPLAKVIDLLVPNSQRIVGEHSYDLDAFMQHAAFGSLF